MKKTYIKPKIRLAEVGMLSVVCVSEVKSIDSYDIEWGGVDEDGLLEPE